MQKNTKKGLYVILGLAVLLGGLFIWHFVRSQLASSSIAASADAPTVVELSTVKSQVWHPQIQAVGTFVAQQGINLAAQIDGHVVQSINFKSGQFVDQGTVLVQLDSSVLAATAAQSKAQYELAKANYQRDLSLIKSKAISKATLDADKSILDAAKGKMDEDAANLAQTTITAPFAGNLGIRQVNIGQYIAKGASIVSLQSVDPILVDFSLPEVYLNQVNVGNDVLITTSAYPGQTFTGKMVAMNSNLDSDTRTLGIRAAVPNKNKLLMPGMFANINVVVPMKSNVLTVPQMSIQYSPFGDTVFVVQNGKAVQRYINLGEQRGSEVAVTRGLSTGETIVSVGGNKLNNGTAVVTKEQLAAQKQALAEKKAGKAAKPVSAPKQNKKTVKTQGKD